MHFAIISWNLELLSIFSPIITSFTFRIKTEDILPVHRDVLLFPVLQPYVLSVLLKKRAFKEVLDYCYVSHIYAEVHWHLTECCQNSQGSQGSRTTLVLAVCSIMFQLIASFVDSSIKPSFCNIGHGTRKETYC